MLLTTLPWVRILSVLSSEQRLSQFISQFPGIQFFSISQSCSLSSDHTAVDSALCFVTLRRHRLSLPDFDERLVPPVSSVPLHCSLSVSSLARRARSGVETDFALLRGGPDRNRFRNLWITTHPMASRVRLGLVPLVSTPVLLPSQPSLAVIGFDSAGRLSQPTFHVAGGKCTVTVSTRAPHWAPKFVARILLITFCGGFATGFWTRVMETNKDAIC